MKRKPLSPIAVEALFITACSVLALAPGLADLVAWIGTDVSAGIGTGR